MLTATDAAAYRRLRLESLRVDSVAFGGAYEEEAALPASFYANTLWEEWNGIHGAIYGAFDEAGELRAIARVSLKRGLKLRHKAVVGGIYVQESFRGQGAAKRLIAACLAQAKKMGAEFAELTVTAGNDGAVRLYESFGFKPWGLEPAALKIGNAYHDEFYFSLKL